MHRPSAWATVHGRRRSVVIEYGEIVMSTSVRKTLVGIVVAITAVAVGDLRAGGVFAPGGTMTTPRTYQGSALLPDGRVFQVGGLADIGITLASAEIYDPAGGGSFAATGSAAFARMRPTTVGLADGRVLVTGGRGGKGGSIIFIEAELYDPATGTFSDTGSLSVRRYVASAVLLDNGRVLVAGGSNRDDGTLASAELYDPATGVFTATGSLNEARDTNAQVARLADGRVFLAGGYNDAGPLASAEVYDPSTGEFTLTGSLPEPRGDHTFVELADGRVLVVAGYDANFKFALTAQLWDPATGQFSATGSLNHGRANPIAVRLVDGRVLIAGGSTTGSGDLNIATAEVYDPATGQFTDVGDMITPRSHGRAQRLADGSVLFMGGWAGVEDLPTANAERFVPAVDEIIFADGFDIDTP